MSGSALPSDVRRWLCPAVESPFTFLGYALIRPLSNKFEGPRLDQGHSPEPICRLSAGHSHRRTSGGKAEPASAELGMKLHLEIPYHS
ncbi:MAG: hypothetical protein QOF62_292 [Pyrinomonadaceae bacterium]|jgi:hypothetical protein|nr:hypothetical protein [Pyrinomonadaceae bacterium]